MVGFLLSLVILLLKPGIVPSVMMEWCLPDLEDLMFLLAVVEADKAPTILLESHFELCDRLL